MVWSMLLVGFGGNDKTPVKGGGSSGQIPLSAANSCCYYPRPVGDINLYHCWQLSLVELSLTVLVLDIEKACLGQHVLGGVCPYCWSPACHPWMTSFESSHRRWLQNRNPAGRARTLRNICTASV